MDSDDYDSEPDFTLYKNISYKNKTQNDSNNTTTIIHMVCKDKNIRSINPITFRN